MGLRPIDRAGVFIHFLGDFEVSSLAWFAFVESPLVVVDPDKGHLPTTGDAVDHADSDS